MATELVITTAGARATDTRETDLQNTTASGTPPNRRVASAAAAFNIYQRQKDQYYEVAQTRAKIQGLYDGNPPYDPSELRRMGRGSECNVNFREMESIIDMNTATAWSLLMDVATLIEVRIRREFMPVTVSEDWGQIIAEEYTTLMHDWTGFSYNLNLSLHEYFKFGLGGCLWPDEWDWRSKAFKSGNVLVPPLTRSETDLTDIVFVRDQMTAGELYRAIENRERAEQAGWKPGAVKDRLITVYLKDGQRSADEDKTQTSVWESWQERIKLNDPSVQEVDFEPVQIVHMLVREVAGDRKISHYIFPDTDSDEQGIAYLFESLDRFEHMHQAIWFLPYSYGDGYLRSSKGLGHRAAPHCEFSNRFLCTLFNGGMLASSLLVQPKTGADSARMSLMRVGPVTMVPENLSIIQATFTPQITGLVQLRALSKDILHGNVGVYKPFSELSVESVVPKTAREVVSQENREAKFERNQVEHFYTHWQMWHRETFRRLTDPKYINSELDLGGQEEAREFIKRCEKRGVPRKVLLNAEAVEVNTARAIGMGSAAVKMDVTNWLVGMAGAMNAKSKLTAVREAAAVRVGYWNVDKYFPLSDVLAKPSDATTIASLENNDFVEGAGTPVGTDQDHEAHFTTHMGLAEKLAMVYEETPQKDPARLVQIFNIILPHASEHLQLLAQNPLYKSQIPGYVQVMKNAGAFFQKLQGEAKKAINARARQMQEAEGEQQGQGMDPEIMLKAQKQQAELQLAAMKADSIDKARQQKTQAGIEMKQQAMTLNQQMEAAKVAAEIDRNARKTSAEIELKRAQAGA